MRRMSGTARYRGPDVIGAEDMQLLEKFIAEVDPQRT